MTPVKKLTDFELRHLCGMAFKLEEILEDYSHVSEHLPKVLIDSIRNYHLQTTEELLNRTNTLNKL